MGFIRMIIYLKELNKKNPDPAIVGDRGKAKKKENKKIKSNEKEHKLD